MLTFHIDDISQYVFCDRDCAVCPSVPVPGGRPHKPITDLRLRSPARLDRSTRPPLEPSRRGSVSHRLAGRSYLRLYIKPRLSNIIG